MRRKNRSQEQMESLKQLRLIAQSRGGKLLSDSYENAASALRWECKEGHTWEATAVSVKNGNHWCPKCAGIQRLTIKDMQEVAIAKGGICLSTSYQNAITKLEWQCSLGHKWFATPQSVRGLGTWCPVCNGNKVYTIHDMQEIARNRGGKCLSAKYKRMGEKLQWECGKGHTWEAPAITVVHRASWCPLCAGNAPKTLDYCRDVARSRGGECVSSVYTSTFTKLRWRCALGHEWDANPADIFAGGWCPTCSPSRRERLCRSLFTALFGLPFKKYRPDWLLNAKGNPMEFDGYCAELNLAWEHHGEQHYKNSNRFHSLAGKTLQERQAADERKRDLCQAMGIRLIEIPYKIPMEEIEGFIREECARLSIRVPRQEPIEISMTDVWSPSDLEAMQAIAERKHGFCLSDEYRGDSEKLRWRCVKNHEWNATPSNIKRGKWCPYCAGVAKHTLALMRGIARERGGECLSTTYQDGRTPLRWRCAEGHEWGASGIQVKRGSWCPACSGNVRLTLEDLKSVATARGGKCLATVYMNSQTVVPWECAKGHRWWASGSSVRNNGSWCPTCAGRPKLGIEDMEKEAEKHGGKFLSERYLNGASKYLWECAKGHCWWASGSSVRNNGSWCPTCYRTGGKGKSM